MSKVRPAPPWRSDVVACWALAWPLILTNAVEMGINVIGVAAIGRLGAEALAAATLAQAIFNLCLLFGIGLTAGVTALLARERGRSGGDPAVLRRMVQQGLWGVLLVTIPLWLVLWFTAPLLRLVGESDALATAGAGYMHVLQWALLPALVYLVLRAAFASLGRPRWAVASGIAGLAVSAASNWALIEGRAGAPALGLQGAALATVAANLVMACALIGVAWADPFLRALTLFRGVLRPSWDGFGGFWRLGLPIGVGLVFEGGMFAAATALVGYTDAVALAAHAVALQVTAFTFMVPLGIAQAATVRVGRALGAGDPSGAERAGWSCLVLMLSVMLVPTAALLLAPAQIVHLFIAPSGEGVAVEALAVTLLAIAALFQIADGAQVVLSGILRGLHDTRGPMVIAMVGYWIVGIPLATAFGFGAGLLAPGVWLGLTAGLFTAAALLFLRWRWRLPRAPW